MPSAISGKASPRKIFSALILRTWSELITLSNMKVNSFLAICILMSFESFAQTFYFGADQSYVNEMEDCGVVYKEEGIPRDVHQIYADHGCNLVRLRIWHTPSWYDDLNAGQRYSDLADVTKSITRAKEKNMDILLNFHLSDNWADPSKQLVPEAWLSVVDDQELLGDSLYQYISNTLLRLSDQGLLPEMVQIGNETNRGILLSPEDNQTYTLDWSRNSYLFNRAIQAVRDVETQVNESVGIMLHVAGPQDIEWFIDEFIRHGVTDFDWIGMSYYWAWHQPATIQDAGAVVKALRQKYPGKEVMVVETGYIWTFENADNANNIISATHPNYHPPSPEIQKSFLVDLTKEIMRSGGQGICYWEPSWVANNCWNQWDQGSHQDHATFFDAQHHLIIPGGIEWMSYDYSGTVSNSDPPKPGIVISHTSSNMIRISRDNSLPVSLTILSLQGQKLWSSSLAQNEISINMGQWPSGIYLLQISDVHGQTTLNKVINL